MAGRISSLWFLSVEQKCTAYRAWVNGITFSNASIYVTYVSKAQIKRMQIAMNGTLRAVVGLMRRRTVDLTKNKKRLALTTME